MTHLTDSAPAGPAHIEIRGRYRRLQIKWLLIALIGVTWACNAAEVAVLTTR